jgi:hypothetical protein
MQRLFVVLTFALLSGCKVLSPVIRSDVLDYSEVIEQTSDKFLLRNILEARDNAPLHFVELPKINGSLQATASLQSAIAFAARAVNGGTGTVNDSVTPTITVQSQPSFEVDNLATKEFVTGLSSPIAPTIVKYWVDRGLDPRIILFLFFSSARITETCDETAKSCTPHVITVHNSPRDAADFIVDCKKRPQAADCHARAQFELYLKLVDSMRRTFVAHSYQEQSTIAIKVPLEPKEIANFDPSQYQLELSGDTKTYTVYSALSEPKVALCLVYGTSARALAQHATEDACLKDVVTDKPAMKQDEKPSTPIFAGDDPDYQTLSAPCEDSVVQATTPEYCKIVQGFLSESRNAGKGRFSLDLVPRSAAEMVRFLGDLLYYQDQLPIQDGHHNVPVTLGFDWDCARGGTNGSAECLRRQGGWLFRVNGNNGAPRIALRYRKGTYTIAENDPSDHSLEVLSVVNLVVNLNKSASDLKTTPTIRVIP